MPYPDGADRGMLRPWFVRGSSCREHQATGKSSVAALLATELGLPLLSLDDIKEALGDSLGLGDERWSNAPGDATAEIIFRLGPSFPGVVAEGWWRRERRVKASQ